MAIDWTSPWIFQDVGHRVHSDVADTVNRLSWPPHAAKERSESGCFLSVRTSQTEGVLYFYLSFIAIAKADFGKWPWFNLPHRLRERT